MTEELFGYQEIGGDSGADMSIESDLAGRPGSVVNWDQPDR